MDGSNQIKRAREIIDGDGGDGGGAVYAWGRGELGQLGVGDDIDHLKPTPLASLANKDIVHIAVGDYHTAFLNGTLPLQIKFYSFLGLRLQEVVPVAPLPWVFVPGGEVVELLNWCLK